MGLTVTPLGAEEFRQTAAVTVSDLLNTELPSVNAVDRSAQLGGSSAHNSPVDIHGLGYLETLVLVDGMRIPLMNTNLSFRDPSIIPSIALQRADVFADGASATYGADAVAGVINLVLRRNFDGAITEGRYEWADGTHDEQVDQLFGRTWSTGGITISGEWYDKAPLLLGSRAGLYGCNLTAYGVGNLCGLVQSTPATIVNSTATTNPQLPVSFPSLAAPTCTNCYQVPAGQNGAPGTLAWPASFTQGDNRSDPSKNPGIEIAPEVQRLAFTTSFDQQITDTISFFASGFWSNRVGSNIAATSNGTGAYFELVKNNNPYYPVNGPVGGLDTFFDLGDQLPPINSFTEHAEQAQGGFDFALPFDWHARLTAAISEYKETALTEDYNTDNIQAALGQTVTASGILNGVSMTETVTKPANIPYLNVFCDPTKFACNDPATFAYIRGEQLQHATDLVHQYEFTSDGRILSLPAGNVMLAIGGDYVTDGYSFNQIRTDNTLTAQQPNLLNVGTARTWYAAYGELRIPVIGEANAIPLVRRFEIDGAYRYDHYSDFGDAENPEVRADWEAITGVTFHANYGTGFRAPTLNDISDASAPISLVTYKMGTSAAGDSHFTAAPGTTIEGLRIVGSTGGLACIGLITRPCGYALKPETSTSTSFGVTIAPPEIPGLTGSANYYDATITNFINQAAGAGAPAVVNAAYDQFVTYHPSLATINAVLAMPGVNQLPPGGAAAVQYVQDGANINSGALHSNGIDYDLEYTTPIADTGDWNIGIRGTEVFTYKQQLYSGAPWLSLLNTDQNDGRFPTPESRRIRGQLGWTDNELSIEGFVNYRSKFADSFFSNVIGAAPGYARVASYTTFDLAIGYDLGDRPANIYLRNVRFDFVVQNVFNRPPPFELNNNPGVDPLFSTATDSPVGRLFSIRITKNW